MVWGTCLVWVWVFGIVVIRLFAFDFPWMFVLVGLFARLFVVLGASWWAVWVLVAVWLLIVSRVCFV